MARASLATLITQVRTLIYDPAGAGQQFSDDDLQVALDDHRQEMRFVTLQPSPTFVPSGGATQVLFFDYYSDSRYWEDDVVMQNAAYQTITPTTSENLVGHWYFAAQPIGIAVIATGKTFDLYKTGADLLRKWATALKMSFNFASDVQTFSLQQKVTNMLSLAKEYDRQANPTITRLVQADAAPDFEGGGIVYPDAGGLT